MPTDAVPFLLSDNPITTVEEDRLHRKPYAHHLAEFLCSNTGSDSLVMAIQGPWGSGKTSILNLVAEEIGDRTFVLRFNPWLFSGSEQLVSQFFIEVSSQLLHNDLSKLKKLANLLEKYGNYFASIIGKIPHSALFQVGFKAFSFYILWKSRQPVSEIKKELEDQFMALDRRTVIFIDDIDRMRDDEVREIVRLVRLVGNFPNVTYVLAYDQSKVTKALDPDPNVGLVFLEKIVQVSYEVPTANQEDLDQMCFEALDACLAVTPHRDLDDKEWRNLWPTIIRPLLRTPRDVRRYTISLPTNLRSVAEEIALADLLAIEAIRVMMPNSFRLMANMQNFLTTDKQTWRGQSQDAGVKAAFDELFASGGGHAEVLHDACRRLFPSSQSHLNGRILSSGSSPERQRERRISHPDVFSFYLRHALTERELSTCEVEEALRSMSNRDRFQATLRGLSSERQESLLRRIESYEGVYPTEAIETGIGAILDCFDLFSRGSRVMFGMDGVTSAMRVVYRLLNQSKPEDERVSTIQRLLPTLRWHSAAQELIRASKGHHFIQEDLHDQLLEELYVRFLDTTPERLQQEQDLWRLTMFALEKYPDKSEKFLKNFERDPLFFKLLESAMGQGHRQSGNNLYSEVFHTLPWEDMLQIFGKDKLLERIMGLPDPGVLPTEEPVTATAVDLAKKYAAGWRPDDSSGRFPKPSVVAETDVED